MKPSRLLFSLALVPILAASFGTCAHADSYHNSKMGNPRPASTQAPVQKHDLYYFICAPEDSKHSDVSIDHIVLSISEQRLYAFHDAELIAWSNVSTGKAGHDTPLGTFKITQKHADHYSNKYNNAPMPYFMRLTDDGVGFHAGQLPGYAASHGCIRLPMGMARELYSHTPSGTPVTIISGPVDPAYASNKSPSFFPRA